MKNTTTVPLRIISGILLILFCWTFCGIFDIAYAVTSGAGNQKTNRASKTSSSSHKFQNALDDLYQTFNDPSRDTDTKKNKAKAKKAEIESLDSNIRKQFSDTEIILKDKGLPSEILERQRNFVKRYEDNLTIIKTDLENIDKAKSKADADAAIEKAKAHLEKVKSPKKHKTLDPDHLPVSSPEEKKARLEQYITPKSKAIRPDTLRKSNIQKPILVAANGSLRGLLDSSSQQQIQLTQANTPALKNTSPTADDLQETAETKITPAIRAKAAELGNNPYKMWNWVLNNIDYVPTYGSIQGADMCLQTKQCNDFDTASLMIALFRSAGFPSRYIYATKEMPIDKFMNWVGGFTDPMTALNFAASAGIPVKGMVEGGQIRAVQFQHVWSISYIPYLPSRQGRPTDNIKMWIHLDGSLPKTYQYTSGIDIKTAVPFDSQAFIDQIKSSAHYQRSTGICDKRQFLSHPANDAGLSNKSPELYLAKLSQCNSWRYTRKKGNSTKEIRWAHTGNRTVQVC